MLAVALNKGHRAVIKAASKDTARPVLTGVHVTPDYIEAANGFMVVRIPIEAVDGIESSGDAIIPAKALADGLRGLKRHGEVVLTIDGDAVEFHNNGSVLATTRIKGVYPNADNFLPEKRVHDGQEVFATSIAPEYLKAIGEIGKALGSSMVRLQFGGPTTPIRIDFSAGWGKGGCGAVMPMFAHYDS